MLSVAENGCCIYIFVILNQGYTKRGKLCNHKKSINKKKNKEKEDTPQRPFKVLNKKQSLVGCPSKDFKSMNMWVFPKIGGNPPKMDGLFHGKPYQKGMIWGVSHIFGNTHVYKYINLCMYVRCMYASAWALAPRFPSFGSATGVEGAGGGAF